MASNFFAMISRLKYIDRWALMRNTHEENLSEHCMETACIAHALAVIGNRRFGKYYNAERAALLGLYHDAPETLTGDMPTPVKYYSPHIREAYAQVEQSACEHLVSMLPEDLRADFAPFFFKDEFVENLIDSRCAEKVVILHLKRIVRIEAPCSDIFIHTVGYREPVFVPVCMELAG